MLLVKDSINKNRLQLYCDVLYLVLQITILRSKVINHLHLGNEHEVIVISVALK